MKEFKISYNNETAESRLLNNGFEKFKFKSSNEVIYIAKLNDGWGVNKYITVTGDMDCVDIFDLPRDITEKDFIDAMTGDNEALTTYVWDHVCCDEEDESKCSILYVLGLGI